MAAAERSIVCLRQDGGAHRRQIVSYHIQCICTNILHCGLPWASPATDGNKMPSGVAQPKNYYPPCPKPAIPNQYFQRMAGIWSGTGERSKAAFMNCSISARCMVPLPVAGEAAGLRPT